MKKIISLFLLAVLLIMSTITPILADEVKNEDIICSSWAKKDITNAIKTGIIPEGKVNMKENITREETAKLALYFYLLYETELPEAFAGFKDTNDLEIEKAVALGLIKGTHKNLFSPNQDIKREDVFIVIDNLLNKINIEIPTNLDILKFKDSEDISDKAFPSAQKLYKLGLIEGVGGNQLKPQDNMSTQEIIAILVRVQKLQIESNINNLTSSPSY